MDLIKDGWFSEKYLVWPGLRLALEVKEILHHEKSKYQDILIVKTGSHGTALILDGLVQCTELDEISYQEMIAMLPLCAHPSPERVLIVGGGDGGVARDVVKHPLVRSVHQVEIDERVVELSRRYLPWMAKGFDSPKMTLHIGDGFEFLKTNSEQFDVIITDSSDPVGPNESLFQEGYFKLLKSALRPGGIVCCQAGMPWFSMPPIRQHINACQRHFPQVKYALTSVPTYPTGQIGFVIGCTEKDCDPSEPKSSTGPGLRYYNSALHRAAFCLPSFMQEGLFE